MPPNIINNNILGNKRPRCFKGVEESGIIWSEREWVRMGKATHVNPLHTTLFIKKNDTKYIRPIPQYVNHK